MSKTPPPALKSPVHSQEATDTVGIPASSLPGLPDDTPQRIGDFTVVRVLGQGGMGTVYLAEDGQLGRKAAIKTMKPELAAKPENRQRFVREARAAATVEHDNIVPIWQIGQASDGSPFIAMPFLQGEMLEARLQREPIQTLGVILKVAREVAEGLAAAHARGLMHRDIKPGNVWIEGDPASQDLAKQVRRCKILDFGLARCVEEDVQVTASGTILGTPAYMAPEQAAGDKVDHRADLFSLGVMLYRMSTGKLPFAGPNTMAVLSALATKTPPLARSLNPDLAQAVSDLIARLMCKDPAGRPQSAAQVAATVRKIVKDLQAKKAAPAGAVTSVPVPQAPPTQNAPVAVAKTPEDTAAVEPEPALKPRAKGRRIRAPLLGALAVMILVPVGWWLATVVLRVETPEGTLVVEIDDPDVEARIKNGKLILTDADGKVRYILTPSERNRKLDAGPYKIHVEGADGLVLDTPEFTLKKGDKVTVRVTVDPKAVAKGGDADRKAAEMQAWLKRVAGLAAEKQVAEFKAKMKELNPDFDGQVTHKTDGDVVTEVQFVTDKVADIAPIQVFNALRVLDCSGTHTNYRGNGQLADLTPMKSMNLANLTTLKLNYTKVEDTGLGSFKNCKNLANLYLHTTQVGDAGLAHFKDCKNLTALKLQQTQVTAAKIGELKKALPKCKIQWDGGVIEPTEK